MYVYLSLSLYIHIYVDVTIHVDTDGGRLLVEPPEAWPPPLESRTQIEKCKQFNME